MSPTQNVADSMIKVISFYSGDSHEYHTQKHNINRGTDIGWL